MAARDQVMSSTERAPEPTMEEILASIRRIISDDEANVTRQPGPAAQSRPVDEGLEGGEGEPDDEIINDIARVLSNSGGAAPQEAPAESADAPEDAVQEDEILDLTAELGGLELVEEAEELELVEVVEEESPIELFNPAPARPAEFAASAEPEPEQASELELVEEVAEEEPAPAFEPEPAAEAPPVESPPPRQMSASEEAASALERAIAALRAGQVPMSPAFSFQPQPDPVFAAPPAFQPAPEPAPPAEPAPSTGFASSYEPVSIPEPASAPEPVIAEVEPEPAAEAESEFVLTEVEAEGSEPVLSAQTVTQEPQGGEAWRSSPAPSWRAEPEVEALAPHVNGGSQPPYASGAPKSLEDSVKDMLRPMLQKWLDENMTRVLTAALKDELKDNPARLRGE